MHVGPQPLQVILFGFFFKERFLTEIRGLRVQIFKGQQLFTFSKSPETSSSSLISPSALCTNLLKSGLHIEK